MQKIDYLETKVNDILHELSFYKSKYNELHEAISNISTENYIFNPDFKVCNGLFGVTNTIDANDVEAVDGWYFDGNGDYIVSSYLCLVAGARFRQTIDSDFLPRLKGQDLTLSFKFEKLDTIDIRMGVRVWTDESNYLEYYKVAESVGVNSLTFNVPNEAVKIDCYLHNCNTSNIYVTPLWAKLEKGIVFTSFDWPIHEIEKLKCNKDRVQYAEVVYDKDSDDERINLGYTSGINSGELITLFNFQKYKAIKIYTKIPEDSQVIYVDFSHINSNSYYYGSSTNLRSSNGLVYHYTRCAMLETKKAFFLAFYKGTLKVNGASGYYCYKIEGIK